MSKKTAELLKSLNSSRLNSIIEGYSTSLEFLSNQLVLDPKKYFSNFEINNNFSKGIIILYDSLFEELKHELKKMGLKDYKDKDFFRGEPLATLGGNNLFFIINLGGNTIRHLREWQHDFSESSIETFLDTFQNKKSGRDFFQEKYDELKLSNNYKIKQKVETINTLVTLGFPLKNFLDSDKEIAFKFVCKFDLNNTNLSILRIRKLITYFYP